MKNKVIFAVGAVAIMLAVIGCAPAQSGDAMTEKPTEAAMTEAMTPEAMTEAAMTEEAMTPAMTEDAMTEAAMTEDAMMADGTDSVAVSDQKLGSDKSLVIDKVVAAADGWLVIHADASGKPGPVLGYAAVKKGENAQVKVALMDASGVTDTLWAMLHVDAGTVGTYEFPGADAPVKDAKGNIVMLSFKVTR